MESTFFLWRWFYLPLSKSCFKLDSLLYSLCNLKAFLYLLAAFLFVDTRRRPSWQTILYFCSPTADLVSMSIIIVWWSPMLSEKGNVIKEMTSNSWDIYTPSIGLVPRKCVLGSDSPHLMWDTSMRLSCWSRLVTSRWACAHWNPWIFESFALGQPAGHAFIYEVILE